MASHSNDETRHCQDIPAKFLDVHPRRAMPAAKLPVKSRAKPSLPAGKSSKSRHAVAPAVAAPAGYHHGDLRAALITAAEEVLTERGIEGLTLRECARRAGVSHGAPAHHFGDINGLLDAVGQYAAAKLDERMAQFQARAGNAATPAARLMASGLGYIDFAMEHAGLFCLAHRGTGETKGAGSNAFARLEAGLRETMPHMANSPREAFLPQMLMRWSVVHGFSTLMLEGRFDAQRGSLSRRDFAQVLGRIVLEQMRPPSVV